MRKRSKYRPKGVLLNPVGYVLESMTALNGHGDVVLTVRLKNHAAMTALTQGTATRKDIDTLIQVVNVTEALYRLGFGAEYAAEVKAGMGALLEVGRRGAQTHRFVLKAQEMTALNVLMELHDAQLDIITVKDMERATKLVREEYRLKRAIPINTQPKENH